MTRIVRNGLLVIPALALLGGCVLDPFGLPSLGSGPASSAPSPFYYGSGYGAYDPRYGYYGYGSRYGYPAYRYDPLLGYATPGYGYYYGPGYGYYRPYPRGPYCVDANRDGRCDTRPPRDDDHGQPPGGGNAGGDTPGGGSPGGGSAGGGPHDGRDGLGRNPIRRLRDIDRPVPAGAVRTPVSPAPQQQAPPARPPGASSPPPRTPVTARPGRGPGDTPRGRPADGPRIRDLDAPSRSPIAPKTVER
ncbi:MAG TPA: hypothetical protein VNS57_15180 [Steroidobacteraceae bacterium]|nr:hypothetical protein [Steroidobacteraceae bacterium]